MNDKKRIFFELIMLTLATVVLDVGVYFFKFPNNFSFGGVTGVSVILSKLFSLSSATYNLIINMALLLLGFIFLSKGFGIKTVYISVLSSLLLSAMEHFIPMDGPLTDEPVLELIFAIVLPAVSAAIMFNLNASGGGTDIIAMILRKYTTFDIGTALFMVDLGIVVAACFVFDVKTALFSFVGLMAKTLVVDTTIENVNLCKYFTIITNQPQDILDFIHDELGKGATIFEAKGSYTNQQKYVIFTVLKRGQAVQLRNYIKLNHTKDTFLMITNSSEIIGKGFRGLN
ncbi:MAG: YitT family protein [Agathobacter sp.]